MLRLFTFGNLALGDAATSATATIGLQGLALLTRLAVAGERGVSRDKILALFWPDADQRKASHSLSQTLHRLKSATGHDDLFAGTRSLSLNPARVGSDVIDFESAVLERQTDRVRKLYAGPFLDGVYLPDAPEFERWCSTERHRFASAFTSCLRESAAAATARADHSCAVSLWREIVAADEYDTEAPVELGRVMEAAKQLQTLRSNSRQPAPSAPQPVGPDALCLMARQHLHGFTEDGLRRGIECAERAITLEPRHVLAHITLGSLCIISSQGSGDRSLRQRGVRHCEIAASLASRVAEARMWLAIAANLDGRLEEARELALQATTLEPDNPTVQYTLAHVRMWSAFKSGDWGLHQSAAITYARALSIDVRSQYTLIGAATLYSATGHYDVCRMLVERLCQVERAHGAEVSMISALTFKGHLAFRDFALKDARTVLEEARDRYQSAPHIFAPYVNALNYCCLGDIDRAEARYDAALSAYHAGLEIIRTIPRQIGAGYIAVRLETRLAAAYNRMRMPMEEEAHRRAAQSIPATWDSNAFNFGWLASDGSMHADWATYHAARGNADAMLQSLERAVALGWGDVALLKADPAMAFFADDERVHSLRAGIAARAPLTPIRL
jgi:DNA-binding SARP family transcriptional activator